MNLIHLKGSIKILNVLTSIKIDKNDHVYIQNKKGKLY